MAVQALREALEADGRLRALRRRRERVGEQLERAEQEARVAARQLIGEENDVERVQRGILGLWLRATGKLDERVATEEAEVEAASAMVQAARAQLDRLRAERDALDAEEPEVRARAEGLAAALAAGREALSGHPDGAVLLTKLRERAKKAGLCRELDEAAEAAKHAVAVLEQAHEALGAAGEMRLHHGGKFRVYHPSERELDTMGARVFDAHAAVTGLERELADVASLLPDEHGLRASSLQLDRAPLDGTFVSDGAVRTLFGGLRQALGANRKAAMAQAEAVEDVRVRLAAELEALDAELVDRL